MTDAPVSSGSSSHNAAIASDRALVPVPTPEVGQSWFERVLVRFGLRRGPSIREDLQSALEGGAQSERDDFTPQERTMLNAILRLRETRVEDVMVPRGDVHAVERSTTLAELLRLFEDTGHSRMPVYRETLDDPLGMVHIKDLMLYLTRRSRKRTRRKDPQPHDTLDLGRVDLSVTLASAKLMRRVLFVPPSMLAIDLMGRMQATRTQMALVIDEYGGTDGLVSLEDVVEEVVGDIEDEHDDDDDELIEHLGSGSWEADARAEIDDVVAQIGDGFRLGELAEEVDTLGGLVFNLAGHIPVRGEVVTGVPGWEFRVVEADPRRVRRVQIVPRRAVGRDGSRRRRHVEAGPSTTGAGNQAMEPASVGEDITPTPQDMPGRHEADEANVNVDAHVSDGEARPVTRLGDAA